MRPSAVLFRFTFLIAVLHAGATTAAPGDFQAGVDAFKAGRLEEALMHFQVARLDGEPSKPLLYNLGVVHYRLGNYADAAAVFRELARRYPDSAALASYNLGLVFRARDNQRQALAHFRRAATEAPAQSRLQSLAEEAVRRLSPERAPRPEPGGSAYLSLAGGYDTNPRFEPTSAQADADAFAELATGIQQGVGRLGGWRSELGAELYHRGYADLSRLDLSVIGAGLGLSREHQTGRVAVDLDVQHVRLGGDPVTTEALVEAAWRRWLAGPWRLDADVGAAQVEGASDYRYLDGQRYRFELSGCRCGDRVEASVGYRLEYNERADYQRNGEFFSYSPIRHRLRLELRAYPGSQWALRGALDWQYSDYADDNRRRSAGATVVESREEERRQLELGVTRSLTDSVSAYAAYTYTDNEAEPDRYAYERQEALGGVQWTPSW